MKIWLFPFNWSNVTILVRWLVLSFVSSFCENSSITSIHRQSWKHILNLFQPKSENLTLHAVVCVCVCLFLFRINQHRHPHHPAGAAQVHEQTRWRSDKLNPCCRIPPPALPPPTLTGSPRYPYPQNPDIDRVCILLEKEKQKKLDDKKKYMLYQRNLLQVFSCFTMDATKWAYLKRFKYQKRGPLSLKYQNVRLYAINPARMCKK